MCVTGINANEFVGFSILWIMCVWFSFKILVWRSSTTYISISKSTVFMGLAQWKAQHYNCGVSATFVLQSDGLLQRALGWYLSSQLYRLGISVQFSSIAFTEFKLINSEDFLIAMKMKLM